MTFYLTAAAALVLAVAPAAAQVPATSSGTTLITLGTAGGPLPRPDRAQSSNLLVVNGALYLVDAGGGVTGRLVQSGLTFAMPARYSSPTSTVITPMVLPHCSIRNGNISRRSQLIFLAAALNRY